MDPKYKDGLDVEPNNDSGKGFVQWEGSIRE